MGSDLLAAIRELNDSFRQRHTDGNITQAVVRLTGGLFMDLLDAVSSISSFDDKRDPHGEHGVGKLNWLGEEVLWKIDYWDETLFAPSPDPAYPNVTVRMMTVMLSSEY